MAFAQDEPKGKHKVVVHFNIKSMKRTAKAGKWPNAVHVVFDSPINLHEYNIPLGDMQVSDLHSGGFEQTRITFKPEMLEDLRAVKDVIEDSVEMLQQQSTFLNRFMTFVYSTPRATHQNVIKVEVCKWMASKKSVRQLLRDIAKHPETTLTERQHLRLEDLVTSEVATLYRTAMQDGGCSKELSVKYDISEYEINYMRAVAAKGYGK